MYGKSWAVLKKEKFTVHGVRKLFLFNMIWFFGLTLLFLIITLFTGILAPFLLLLLAIVTLILDFIFRANFSENDEWYEIFKSAKGFFSKKWIFLLLILAIHFLLLNIVFGALVRLSPLVFGTLALVGVVIIIEHAKCFSIINSVKKR